MLVGIVATTKDGLIGDSKSPNGLPWHIKKDLQFFKTVTTGKTLIVGSKTFETLPNLPGRNIIVLTREGKKLEGMQPHTVVKDLEGLRPYILDEKVNLVIGGATIYNLLMPFCDHFLVTEIFGDFEGDSYFPIDKLEEDFEVVRYTPEVDESGVPLIFKIYRKRRVI